MSKQTDELRQYLIDNKIKQAKLAKELGIARPTMCNILSGRQSLSQENAIKISDYLGLDKLFLLTGIGSLVPASAEPSEQTPTIEQENTPITFHKLYTENIRLTAENEQVKKENEWLRSMVKGMIPAPQV